MSSSHASSLNQDGLRAAAEYQTEIIASGDAQAFADFLHPDFMINGPTNRCGRREQVIDAFKSGALQHDQYERVIECTDIVGNIGIIMGAEMVAAADGSPLAAAFGTGTLHRRFTDIYVFEGSKWRFLARQASVVKERKA
jgi:Domain of unknown function (DUF4440)